MHQVIRLVFILTSVLALSTNAGSLGILEPNLAQLFKRVVTRAEHLYVSVSFEERHAFAHLHHVKRCNVSNPINSFHAVDSPYAQWSETLVTRFKASQDRGIIKPSTRFRIGDSSPDTEIKAYIASGFLNGHLSPFEEETTQPHILVTLYARNTINNQPKPLRWFTFLDQALRWETLEEYRANIALSKFWSAYSDFAIAVIPVGAKVKYYFGPVLPQTFPKFDFSKHNKKELVNIKRNADVLKLRASLKALQIPNKEEHRFCESLDGGATQLYITEVDKVDIYEVEGGISFQHNNPIPLYAPKVTLPTNTGTLDVWTETPTNPSHLKDSHYDAAKLDLHGFLKRGEVITPDEHVLLSHTIQNLQRK